jgi:hypothetical protein
MGFMVGVVVIIVVVTPPTLQILITPLFCQL